VISLLSKDKTRSWLLWETKDFPDVHRRWHIVYGPQSSGVHRPWAKAPAYSFSLHATAPFPPWYWV
jgi:hypothetical protein